MDFGKIYSGTATASKQLEARWFFDDKDGQACKKEVHMMPFQRRNLSYWRGVSYGEDRVERPKKPQAKVDNSKKIDLLYTIWKHRVRNYNDAFLSSPRRATRNFSKTTASPTRDSSKRHLNTQTSPSRKRLRPTENSDDDGDSDRKEPPNGKTNGEAVGNDGTGENTKGSDNGSKTSPAKEQAHLVSETEESASLLSNGHPNRFLAPPLTQSIPPYLVELDPETLEPILEFSKQSQGNKDDEDGDEASNSHGQLAYEGVIHPKTKVLFHFLYIDQQADEDSPLCFQTDATPENYIGHRRCPFCYFDGGTDVGLLIHCVTCHSHKLGFKAARSEDGTLHVAVTKKRPALSPSSSFDFVYVRPRHRQPSPGVPIVPFCKRQKSNMDMATRRKKLRLISEFGCTDESVLQQYVPDSNVPIRPYFHSRSNEPMLEGEWDFDSDEETDDSWLNKMGEALMDEFDDVTRSEKQFAKLWNRFMQSHTVIPDHIIPAKCSEFIRTNIRALLDLRQEVMLHFSGMWDAGLISSNRLHQLMVEYDDAKKEIGAAGSEEEQNQEEPGGAVAAALTLTDPDVKPGKAAAS